MQDTKFSTDSVVNSVIHKFINRSEIGLKKYGVTLDREDLHITDWITHAQEEHMDAILYLEKLKKTYLQMDKNNSNYEVLFYENKIASLENENLRLKTKILKLDKDD